jgi:hypothetical protein
MTGTSAPADVSENLAPFSDSASEPESSTSPLVSPEAVEHCESNDAFRFWPEAAATLPPPTSMCFSKALAEIWPEAALPISKGESTIKKERGKATDKVHSNNLSL